MSGPNLGRHRPPEGAHDDLDLDELTQAIDTPLAGLLQGQEEPTLSTLDFQDIENALDW